MSATVQGNRAGKTTSIAATGIAAIGATLLALVAVPGFETAAWAAGSSPARDREDREAVGDEIGSLRATVADLQRQVDALKAAADDRWLTQQRADEIRGLVHDVLADADTRASLLQSGATAGWDNGFFIGSADGNYLLKLGGALQVRGVYNNQDDSPSDEHRSGVEIRRTKLDFRGHVIDPSWQYYVEAEASRSTGAFSLGENGWIQKDMGNGLRLRFGQFKPLFAREESISSRRLQGVERSQINTQFTAGTAQGVQAMYETDRWRINGAVIDGTGTGNTAWSAEDTEYALTARGEFIAIGDWKAVEDDIGWRGGAAALMFGAGALWQRAEFGTGSNLPPPDFNNAEVENLTLTADATWKMSSFSLSAAGFYRRLSTEVAGAVDLDQYGVVVRGGFFVQDDFEIYAMHEWGDLDIAGIDDLSVITVGATKYFAKHNLKWQNDIGFGLNSVAANWAVDAAGWRADAADEDGQIVVRSQFQLLF
jgi:hypothetical protein